MATTSGAKPLAVDLDGTLIKTDLLQETLSSFICSQPLRLPQLLLWLCQGGLCQLKTKLASNSTVEIASLPWHQEVLAWLRQEKQAGRKLILATASDITLANQVQQHLQLFDEVLATENNINLRRANKEQALIASYGEKGFDYAGNSRDDLYVWRSAAHACIVTDSKKLRAAAGKICAVERVFASGRKPLGRTIMRTLQPTRWRKNLLLLIPLIISQTYNDASNILLTAIAFTVFSIAVSSACILRGIANRGHDRGHPDTRDRPFAASDISLAGGWFLLLLLLASALAISLTFMPPAFSTVLCCYILLAWAHALVPENFAIFNVLATASLHTLTLAAGAVAIAITLPLWLLPFAACIFIALDLGKWSSRQDSEQSAS